MDKNHRDTELLHLVTDVVSSYVSNNTVPVAQLADLIHSVRAALLEIPSGKMGSGNRKPAVDIKKSIHPDYIVCLEDGKKLKLLKRHLRTAYNMTPDEYRAKWGLPDSYPMVAPNYAAKRSQYAKNIGLGKKSRGRRKKSAGAEQK
ncbi:MAG: MucR family transcriptional regulator [Pseudomonadota bacterium]|nr:MucR family transcriptional regulator [Pseudomonadota bacterium]